MNRTPHLLSILVLPLVVVGCSSDLSTRGQLITCATDPGTGVILSCTPGGDDSDDPNTCIDIDEDGDGECSDDDEDEGAGSGSGSGSDDLSFAPTEDGESDDDDDDDDGIPDDDDCDEHPGEDSDDDESDVDLPYDIEMNLGETYTPIADAFAEKGALPAAILSVSGATWRAAELQAGTAFTIDQADCDHAGNRDVGRDRVIVTWMNTDGSMDADHLDLRYCK